LRYRSAMRNEQHDLARQRAEQRLGDAPGHAAKTAVGVEERRPGVEPDAHGFYDATAERRWSVVIPTRAGWGNLASTLPPLLAAISHDDEVVVVGDRCDPHLPEGLDARCRAVGHAGPAGFAPTCNRGAREACGHLLLILNDDVLVGRGLLERLEAELGRPGVGAVGPNVISRALARSESGTTVVWHRGVLESRQGALGSDGVVTVPYLCGAALAVRRVDFLRLGGFDERLAPYFWEDLDLSLRLREHVGETVVVGDVTVMHRHGATIENVPERDRRVVYERNRLLVTWRHLRGWRWLAHLAWMPLRLVAGLLRDRAVPAGFVQALNCLTVDKGRDARRD
jgi:GT2 family glycosyltransferase